MFYLDEADIIKMVAEKHKVEPKDVTPKIDLAASRVMAIVDKRRGNSFISDVGYDVRCVGYDMRMTNEGNAFHIFER